MFVSSLSRTNNLSIFWKFMLELKRWIIMDLNLEMASVGLILDYSPVHKALSSMKTLNELGWYIILLPAYTSDLNPIELLFHRMKRLITRQSRDTILKLDTPEGDRNIREALSWVGEGEIIRYWRSFMKIIRAHF